MIRRILISTSMLALASSSAWAIGCSSSSNNGGGFGDSGTGSGSGGESDGSGGDATGSSSGGGSGGSSGGDASGSGSGSGGGSGSSSGSSDGGVTCAPGGDAGTYASITYAAATKGQNLCVTADITGFISACVGAGASQATCGAYITNNVAGQNDGGGAGTACGNCIFPQSGGNILQSGPLFFTTLGFTANYGDCIGLLDPTAMGASCGGDYNNVSTCDYNYCSMTCNSDAAHYDACAQAANGSGGLCNSYDTSFKTDCANDFPADGGTSAASACFPGTGTTAQATDISYIVNLICGTGM